MSERAPAADEVDAARKPPASHASPPPPAELPPVEPPSKLPVMGVPTDQEAKLVSAEATRFRSRSKYRGWA